MENRPEYRREHAESQSTSQLQLQLDFSTVLDRLPANTPLVFFEHLMRKLELHNSPRANESQTLSPKMDPKDQWLCYLGLRLMHNESKNSRFERDTIALKATWQMIEPLLRDTGILFGSKNDPDTNPDTQEMMTRFLANDPPLVQTMSRHQARAYTRKMASKRRRQLSKSFELHNGPNSVSM